MTQPIVIHPPLQPRASYPILIEAGLLQRVSDWLPDAYHHIVIITDTWVYKTYGQRLEHSLQTLGKKVLCLTVARGERSKTIGNKCRLEQHMLVFGCDRDSVIIALGGGVIGDLAGFIAATYMRGIAYLQLPTTLLAMVDSAVGGKTGIDTPQGKNVIGAFWQPSAVIADIECLQTLPQRHLINGLIEAVKMFITSDRGSLEYVDRHLDAILARDAACLVHVVQRAVRIKAGIVARDEREQGMRAILNWGHTIGHALEYLSGYRLLHGYAVALGCLVEAKVAQLLGVLNNDDYDFICALFARLGIEAQSLQDYAVADVIQQTYRDKKKRGDNVHYVMVAGLGRVFSDGQHYTHPVSDEVIQRVFLSLTEG